MKIRGERDYLWRAVDHEGAVLESYVTKKRDEAVALKSFKKSMKRYGSPHIVVTDKYPSYQAAMKVISNDDRLETGRHLNNRAENSHLPFRRRERAMSRFRRMRSLQKFVSIHSSVYNHFNFERHTNTRLGSNKIRCRPSRVARSSCRRSPAHTRITETGSYETDTIICSV
ncbi:DDE-type integrase/transposase/recombinase [Hyphomonas sp.]|uniref:DDE-type integrase/transposase/recombinase n=1 Tax=Hyphomonas sp. TaxID=87 RepID=UPI0030F74942